MLVIKVVPPSILLGHLGRLLLCILPGDTQFLVRVAPRDEALEVVLGGLVVVDLARVDGPRNQLLPVAVALLEDVDDEGGVLVGVPDDGDEAVAAGNLVVLAGVSLLRSLSSWRLEGGGGFTHGEPVAVGLGEAGPVHFEVLKCCTMSIPRRVNAGCGDLTVHEGRERVVHVDGEHLPVRLLSLQ